LASRYSSSQDEVKVRLSYQGVLPELMAKAEPQWVIDSGAVTPVFAAAGWALGTAAPTAAEHGSLPERARPPRW